MYPQDEEELESDYPESKSKTQVKKEMHDLQKIGERLAALSDQQINQISMPEELSRTLKFVKTIKSRAAHRRELKHIGGMLRKVDIEPIMEALEILDQNHLQGASQFRKHEKWREELIGGNEELLTEIKDLLPDMDIQKIRQLIRNARKEREKEKPPKSSRELFRYLRDLDE